MELKLSAMSANVPGTSTTGSGWLLLGWQDQSLAPGGGESGAASAWATPPKALYGTGSGIRARVAAAALARSGQQHQRQYRGGERDAGQAAGQRQVQAHNGSLRGPPCGCADWPVSSPSAQSVGRRRAGVQARPGSPGDPARAISATAVESSGPDLVRPLAQAAKPVTVVS